MISVKVVNTPRVDICITKGDWKAAAKQLRAGVAKLTDFYDRALVYYFILSDMPPAGQKRIVRRFEDALGIIKKFYHLTGGVRQVVFLCGWQHDGPDTGYPDVFTVNSQAGSLEELNRCIEEAKKYNAVLTFHDNYDDCYDNEYFDPEIAALDWNGNYMTSWI
jgi:sugar phosphate isomerase/epimerase